MDRSRFGFGEYLTADTTAPDTNDDKLNRAFDRVEASADERMLDVITRGVVSGMEVTEAAVPNMTIRVLAGIAYDQTGRRLEIPSTQSIDPLTDFGGSPIALPDSGKEKYSSIYIKSSRLNQESTQDSNSVQYYQSELEHFVIRVRGGSQAPAGTATPPALVGDEILLADILLVNGMTTITDGDIDLTTRRQTSSNVGALDETAIQHTNGSEKFAGNVNPPASGDLRTWLRQLVTDLGKTTATTGAQRIGHVALGNYADASSGPGAGGIGGQLSSWFTAMSASGGTAKVGSAALSGSPTNVGSGTLLQTLQALLNAINDRARLGVAETISGAWTFSTVPTMADALNYTSASVTRTAAAASFGILVVGGTVPGGLPVNVKTGDIIGIPFEPPHGNVLTSVTVYVSPAVDGILPGTRPALTIIRRDTTDGSSTTIGGPTTDPNATLLAYEAYHGFSVTGMTETVDRTKYYYYARFDGESGSNPQDILCTGLTWTITHTKGDKAAG